jgi:hypothetical protein
MCNPRVVAKQGKAMRARSMASRRHDGSGSCRRLEGNADVAGVR